MGLAHNGRRVRKSPRFVPRSKRGPERMALDTGHYRTFLESPVRFRWWAIWPPSDVRAIVDLRRQRNHGASSITHAA